MSSTNRNIVIGSVVAVLALGLGYFLFSKLDDIVKIKVSAGKIDLPKDLKEKLGVTRILLADKDGKLIPLTADGDPINLCGSGGPECKLATSSKELVAYLSGACGFCSDGSSGRFCHKDSGTYPCHDKPAFYHHACVSPCQ